MILVYKERPRCGCSRWGLVNGKCCLGRDNAKKVGCVVIFFGKGKNFYEGRKLEDSREVAGREFLPGGLRFFLCFRKTSVCCS